MITCTRVYISAYQTMVGAAASNEGQWISVKGSIHTTQPPQPQQGGGLPLATPGIDSEDHTLRSEPLTKGYIL